MRIGIVAVNIGFRFNEAQARVNHEIVGEALRRGHEVVLYCERVDTDMAAVRNVSLELMPAPAWLPSRLFRDQLFAWRSKRHPLLASAAATTTTSGMERCDAILSNAFVTWAATDVSVVHFVHSSWRKSSHHPWRQRRTLRSLYSFVYNSLNAVLERGAFRRSTSIVAVSNKVRAELIEIGVAASEITTIVNGVDAETFCPGAADRAGFGLPQGVVIALFAGDLNDSRKNLDTVLKALRSVPELHLAVAGRHEGTPWPRLAAELGVADRVHFLGFQKNMPQVMRASDLLVFPSRYEACSLVLLEAMASGLPVVTARSAGGAELVTPQVGIVIEDSEDAPALVEALRSLECSEEKRQTMARGARAQALEYSWPVMASRYVDLLEHSARYERVV